MLQTQDRSLLNVTIGYVQLSFSAMYGGVWMFTDRQAGIERMEQLIWSLFKRTTEGNRVGGIRISVVISIKEHGLWKSPICQKLKNSVKYSNTY